MEDAWKASFQEKSQTAFDESYPQLHFYIFSAK